MADKNPMRPARAPLAALFLSLSLSLGACAQTPAASAPGALRHGIVQFDGQGGVVLVTAQPAPARGEVLVQVPDAQGDAMCCKRLPLSAFKVVKAPEGAATDEVSGRPPVMLRGHVARKEVPMPFVGAAVVGDVRSARMSPGGGITAQGQDGRTVSSSTCISEEGFHVMEKAGAASERGRPGKGLLTHLYLGLGYEIDETTCR